MLSDNYYSLSARERITLICDNGSFKEICPPSPQFISPHLVRFNLPYSQDDGVITGYGIIGGYKVMIASQDRKFYGGSVGEIHGAKIKGLLEKSLIERPDAFLLMIDSGGVRLQEANAGFISVSEISKAILKLQRLDIPVVALIGGGCGAFGGMGLVARLCSCIIMSDKGRMGLTGPEVIETVHGKNEFDSRNTELVWKITGGKTKFEIGEANYLVSDSITQFRDAVIEYIKNYKQNANKNEIFRLIEEQILLKKRLKKLLKKNNEQ